jgi:hypothetical protein
MAKNDPIVAGTLFTGEDKTLAFTVYEDDGVSLQDITGYTLAWQLRVARDSVADALTKDGAAITITNGPQGECEVEVARADTLALEPGTYWHELIRTDSGAETVLTYGDAVLMKGRVA